MPSNHELVSIALEQVDGFQFEKFVNAFLSAALGSSFVPLGGVHDGGADGILLGVTEDERGRFLQTSIRDDIENKVRDTITALRKVGRDPKQITYATSNRVMLPEQLEDKLFDKHGVIVKIRDRSYFSSGINQSEGVTSAFTTYLKPLLAKFAEIGSADLISGSSDLPSKSLVVFLGQELDRRRGETDVLESVTDTLILWALKDTDPDKKKFLSRAQILTAITDALPSAKQFINGVIDQRLAKLASKDRTGGREIRHHRREAGFCLPYETRQLVVSENLEDELLKSAVGDVFRRKIHEAQTEIVEEFDADDAVRVCFRAVELVFQKQGIEVSHFLEAKESEAPVHKAVSLQIEQAVEEFQLKPTHRSGVSKAAFYVLRKAFYHSEEVERVFFSKLSRTFCLLFTLRNHPEIVEYFKGMAKRFVLYIGSDLIVRALSERYLPAEDRMTRNLFKLLRDADAKLLLTERTLEEVHTHIIACDQEYKNHYQRVDRLMTPQLARQIDELLIRAYFYAAFDIRTPDKRYIWPNFVNQFMTHADLHLKRGRDSLQHYLCDEFGFEFEEETVSRESVHYSEIQDLKEEILRVRPKKGTKADLLAENDAFQILRVYSKRTELKEGIKPSRYGYQTWWLTQETAVRRATEKLVNLKGAQYIMRPELLLNYIALSPSTAEVRRSYDTIFPSLLGVQLSNRMRPDVFEDFIRRIDEAQELEESRARTLAREYSNKLIADQFKPYSTNLGSADDLHRGGSGR